MILKGSIHLIHKLDNFWIFLTTETIDKKQVPKRIPFLTNDKLYEDGQELEVFITQRDGVEIATEKGSL